MLAVQKVQAPSFCFWKRGCLERASLVCRSLPERTWLDTEEPGWQPLACQTEEFVCLLFKVHMLQQGHLHSGANRGRALSILKYMAFKVGREGRGRIFLQPSRNLGHSYKTECHAQKGLGCISLWTCKLVVNARQGILMLRQRPLCLGRCTEIGQGNGVMQ
eukprot:scaffold242646_cov17-Tisochrysis_lutea.AAC.1